MLSYCLLCNSDDDCVVCESPYLIHQGQCVSSCPQGYEADVVTDSKCIVSDETALYWFLTLLEKFKVLVCPASFLFLVSSLLLLSLHRPPPVLPNNTGNPYAQMHQQTQ